MALLTSNKQAREWIKAQHYIAATQGVLATKIWLGLPDFHSPVDY